MNRLNSSLLHHLTRCLPKTSLVPCGAILVCIGLAGCAAQLAHREGNDLLAAGQVDLGLQKLKEAADKDPAEIQFKTSYLHAKETVIAALIQAAENEIAEGKLTNAEQHYRHILRLEPGNRRAINGIQIVDMQQRHVQLLTEAETAIKQKNTDLAAFKLRSILSEQPSHADALAMQHHLNQKLAPAVAESQLAASYKKAITIEFRDASLKQLFDVISQSSGINFLFDKDLKMDQRSAIFLRNSTIESAIYFILLTNQLEQQVLDANTILIYPNTASKLKDYQEMVIKTFFLANSEAKTVAATLKTILKSKDIVVDDKLNMLIMRDSPAAIRIAEKLIALQDIAEPEVMLEVEILEVKRTKFQELGIKWPESLSLTPLASGQAGLTLRDLRSNLNSGTIGALVPSTVITARKQDSDANILANPRIRARNHEKAKILIGERVPNVTTTSTSTGFVSESINYLDVGLKLEVEPTVFLDNDVAIKIALEVSNVVGQTQTKAGSTAYQIGTRTANTVLRLKDGETQILAGLINDEDRTNGNKLPGLGDLPVLGRLFGSASDNAQKTEIVLSITPRLIRNIQRPDANLSEFLSGTDSSVRTRPLSAAPQLDKLLDSDSSKTAESGVAAPQNSSAIPTNLNNADESKKSHGKINESVPGSLNWHGPSAVKRGDIFIVQLSLQPDQAISDLPLTLSYNPKLLQVIEINEGNFFRQDGAETRFSSKVDPSGKISLRSSRNAPNGAKNFGIVTTLSLRALASNSVPQLSISSASPIGEDKQPVRIPLPSVYSFQVQ